ncbi:MAG TPA: UDP-N-acetylmuramoyl-tripeptide--D-alanyl-D-alanine ligase [Treponemataceae bacterium]|nr:UDP-N-acetylmuramoyl-tripeptide--D-alanyl-D-alanine ligase [Treponemataceae bacterium]
MAEKVMLMSISQLVEAVNGTCLCCYAPDKGFSSVATDSRSVTLGSLFVPLIGEYQDGHSYIPRAIEAGASVILVDAEHSDGSASVFSSLGKQYGVCFIRVKNTLQGLQDAAKFYVSLFPNLVKIAITGSSGKTTTKELLSSIFSVSNTVIVNEGNLNSETGLPLSVFRIRKEHQFGIFEMGMNRRGEISELAQVVSPSLALITNIGTAHIGILGTQIAIAEEKKEIFSQFDSTCTGFIPEHDLFYSYLSDISKGSIVPFGITTTKGYRGNIQKGIEGSIIQYEDTEILLPLVGSYNMYNALGAITLARYAGISVQDIKIGIEKITPLFGRAQVKKGPVTVMLDCYNANPESMGNAIQFCSDLEWPGKKIFLLGSMLELGKNTLDAHKSVCEMAAKSDAQYVFLFGSEFEDAAQGVDWKAVKHQNFHSMEVLASVLLSVVVPGDIVLIKGSRGVALERIYPIIEKIGIDEGNND